MRSISPEMLRRRRLLANTVFAMAILLCALLLVFPPTRFHFYPLCPVHQYFGILCPGCGATRALAALLHGDLTGAARLNAPFVLLLPAMLAGAVESYRRAVKPGRFRCPLPPTTALYASPGATLLFSIMRNLR